MRLIVVLFTLMSPSPLLAQEQCGTLFRPVVADAIADQSGRVHDSWSAQWSMLRENGLLVNQQSIAETPGLCGAACAVNLVQAVALDLGVRPTAQPLAVFKRFVKAKSLSAGPSSAMIVEMLRALLRAKFKGNSPKVTAIQARGINPLHELVRDVDVITDEDIVPSTGIKKMLLTAHLGPGGQVRGLHTQIVEAFHRSKLSVIEPNAPDLKINLKRGADAFVNGVSVPRFFYPDSVEIEGIESMAVIGVIEVDSRSN